MHNIFYMSPLEQKTIIKEWADEKVTKLEFESGNSEEYKVKTICNSSVYVNKTKRHLSSLYYLVA